MPSHVTVAIVAAVLVIILVLLVAQRRNVRRRRSRRQADAPAETVAPTATPPPFAQAAQAPAATDVPLAYATDTVVGIVASEATRPAPDFAPGADDDISQLVAHVTLESSPTASDRGEVFVIWAKARISEDDMPRRLKREVSLSVRGPDAVDYAVNTTNPEWQRSSRREFYFLSDSLKPRGEDLNSSRWLPILRVPVRQLEMPRKGRCQLRALVSWRDRSSQLVIARSLGVCDFEVLSEGQLDTKETKTEPDWQVARVLAMLLHLPGAPAPAATLEVDKWLEIRTASSLPQKAAQQHRCERLRQAIAQFAQQAPEARATAARDACRKLAHALKSGDRQHLHDFFLRVAAANGQAASPEAASLPEWLDAKAPDTPPPVV